MIVPGPSSLGVPGPGTLAKLACVMSSSVAVQSNSRVPFAAIAYHALSSAEAPLPTPEFASVKDVIRGT